MLWGLVLCSLLLLVGQVKLLVKSSVLLAFCFVFTLSWVSCFLALLAVVSACFCSSFLLIFTFAIKDFLKSPWLFCVWVMSAKNPDKIIQNIISSEMYVSSGPLNGQCQICNTTQENIHKYM